MKIMINCPNCGHANPENVTICLNCASSLLRSCPACGAEMPLGNKFCGQCGQRLEETGQELTAEIETTADLRQASQEQMLQNLRARMPLNLTRKINRAAPRMTGQRREVTVLFVDIADFTSASRVLGSEEIYLVLDEMMHILADVIYKYEGTIDKFTGDGLLALFGIPINHENDPERAVRAALEMQSVVKPLQKRLKNQLNYNFSLRIGIHTGLVIAGSLGSKHHMEYTVIGDTVNLASRLEETAEPDSILASFNTYQRTRPIINYLELPPFELKGWELPVKAFRPIGVRLKPGQVRGLPGLQVPMVGRREDFLQLHQALDTVLERQTSYVAILSGEAGMGKTRLVAEFRNSLAEQPVNVHLGTCASYMRTMPYRVVADILRNIIHVSEMDHEDFQSEALKRYLERLGLEYREILSYLLTTLGLSHHDPMLEARLRLLDPAMLQRQTHAALRSFFIAHAQKSPTVLIFDDLHWVDQASRDFLIHFCQTLEEIPLLVILIARDFSRHDLTLSLHTAVHQQTRHVLERCLEPLSADDSRLLVDQLIQETTENANQVKQIIVDRAGGNPYYTEEMVRILIDRGGIIVREGAMKLTARAEELLVDIPGTLQDIILARFDRLSPPLKKTLQQAAVIGRVFTHSLLEMIFEDDPRTLTEHLLALEKRDFLIGAKLGIEDGYIFKHPLLREAIYNTILKRDSGILHQRIARSIQASAQWLPGEKNEILAYHFKESANPSEAIPYLLAAADKSAQRFANEAVVLYYRQALELMEVDGDQSSAKFRKAQVGLAQALKYAGKFEESANIYETQINQLMEAMPPTSRDSHELEDLLLESLRELADIRAREGNLDLAIQLLHKGLDLLGEEGRQTHPYQWRRLVDRTAWVYFRQGKLEEAFYLADLALFDSANWQDEDPITLASLNNTLGGVYWTRTRHAEAIQSVERSLEIYKSLNYHWGMAIAYTNLGVLNFSTGKWPEAVASLEQADALRSEHGYTPERPTNLVNLGEILACMGDHERAREKLEASLAISRHLGMEIAEIYAKIALSRLATTESKLDEASAHLENASRLLESSQSEVDERRVQILIEEARIETQRGNFDAGLEPAQTACQIAVEYGFDVERNESLQVLGALYIGLGQFDQAQAHLEKSIDLSQNQNDRYHLGLTELTLGRMYIAWAAMDPLDALKKFKSAQEAIDQAIDIFESLGAKYDLHQARKLHNKIVLDRVPASGLDESEELQIKQTRARLGLPEGEWYQAIVVYIRLLPRSGEDEELIFETIALLTPSLLEIINENQGQAIRHPLGITVVFGAPIAKEDDPERALNTAMEIINFYQEFHQQTQLPVGISLGVTMGKVVAGYVGPEIETEFIVAGEPAQEARVIAEVSPSTKIWVTQAVRNATKHRFDYFPISSDLVAGLEEAEIYQLIGLREQIQPVRGLIGLQTPFVGRRSEIRAMIDLSRNLQRGTGGLVWLEGNPGIGKSRLMREFSAQISQAGALAWRGAGSARRSNYAFYLFSELLYQVFDLQPNFPVSQIYELIDKKFQSWPQELAETRPYMELLVGVQPTGPLGEQLANLEPEQLRRQTFIAFRKLVVTLSGAQPIVLMLDDLQWADIISADLLLFLTGLILTHPIMIVGARRDTESGVADETMARTRQMYPEQSIHISIQPLSKNDCYALLDEFFETTELPVNLMDLIVQQSGGNPYFIEEFIRMLLERDYLRITRGQLQVNQILEIDTLSVPSSLETLIRARVDALNSPVRQLLQIASVIGQRFSLGLLQKISEQEDIHDRLTFLQVRGMLNHATEADLWEFSHPLIEVIVYNSVLKAQRRVLHERTAQALEAQWQGDEAEHAEDLAYHFGRAEVQPKALYYLILAGERAAARYANEAAVKYFEGAIDLLGEVADTPDELHWRIATGLGEVHNFVGNFEASMAALQSELDRLDQNELSLTQQAGLYRRYGETLLKKGEPEGAISYFQQAMACLGDIEGAGEAVYTEAALTLERMGWSHFTQANLDKARQIGLQSQAYARQAINPRAIAKAENLLGGVSYRQGETSQAMHHTQMALQQWERMGYSSGVAGALNNLGILEVAAGNWSNALEYFQRSLKVRKDIGDVNGLAMTYNNLGTLAREKGDMKSAESYFRDCLAVATPFQLALHRANATMGVAQALFYQGNIKDAQEMLQSGLAQAWEISARDLASEMGRTQAEILIAQGEYEQAFQTAQKAASLAAEIGNRLMEAGAWRIAAKSKLQGGEAEEAMETLQKAWQAISEADDELETGRIHAQAGTIHLALGDHDGAQKHFEVAGEIFNRLGAARDLELLEAQS
jgi:predicted ATPase/class 3 adenylate cyclase